jgi:hypothetical protein
LAGRAEGGCPTTLTTTAAKTLQAVSESEFEHESGARRTYRLLLTWAFTLFSSLPAVSYLPTLWAIRSSGNSSQHSLWTWGIWLGANMTMASWLY